MSDNLVNVGDVIFNDIDSNHFLHELYANLLHNYAVLRLLPEEARQTYDVDLEAALRFADLLSKSTHPDNRDIHRVWRKKSLFCVTFSIRTARTRRPTCLRYLLRSEIIQGYDNSELPAMQGFWLPLSRRTKPSISPCQACQV